MREFGSAGMRALNCHAGELLAVGVILVVFFFAIFALN